jgi:hypothetical protein
MTACRRNGMQTSDLPNRPRLTTDFSFAIGVNELPSAAMRSLSFYPRRLSPLVSFGACVLLIAGCNETPPKIEQPVNIQQPHLEAVQLPADFRAQVTESVYVPIYSQIYSENNLRTVLLVGTLSIRNTDAHERMIVKSIRYYDTSGKLLEQLLPNPVAVGPFATAEVVVPRRHEAGGSGANFVVDWMSASKIHEPLIEAIMISTGSAQSVSFSTRGVVIERTEGKPAAVPSTGTAAH